jgi:hypothetical protein
MAGTKAIQGEIVTYRGPGQPMKFSNPVEFATLVDAYFKECADLRDIPTITGLAVYLDTDRKTLYNYRKRDKYFPTIKRALNRCEAALEARTLLGGLNPAMAIFSLKNNYGWVDKSEVENSGEVTHKYEQLEDADIDARLNKAIES